MTHVADIIIFDDPAQGRMESFPSCDNYNKRSCLVFLSLNIVGVLTWSWWGEKELL